ncbi:Transcriptional regulator, Lrp family (possible nitrite reductase regulator NirD) [Clostridium acetobutylicum EA 2018]|nr:Transcriptional regulator, Lrp family (possible nitrite reductase regulator NirD) [Clostridium acetobutylicum EA 2018]
MALVNIKINVVGVGRVQPFIIMEILWLLTHGVFIMSMRRTKLMDEKKVRILNMLQTEIPLTERPFLEIGKKLNITEETVIQIVKELKNNGLIRRIGGIFDSKNLGYHTVLCALRVLKENLDEVVKVINRYEGVTHNYERDNYYNVWFTITAKSEKEIEEFLEELKDTLKIEEILKLPAEKVFKINAVFKVKE